jgi:4-aminobutyrate aminotransferase/(S)-3-amino-2-methylpropionate transaminase
MSKNNIGAIRQGDPMRAMQANKIIDVIQEHDLVRHTAETGDKLYSRLEDMFKEHKDVVKNLRGKGMGTFIAWDFHDAKTRDLFAGTMRKNGVQMGPCGDLSVRLRPMLTFGDAHAEVLLEAVEKSLGEVQVARMTPTSGP